MTLSRTDNGVATILRIVGRLDAETAAELDPIGEDIAAMAQPRTIILDLTDLDFIDSAGVSAIVALSRKVRAVGGKVRVAGLRDQPRAICRLLRMDRVLAT